MHHPTDRIAHITAFGALAGTKNSPMGPPCGIDPTTQHIISERYTSELHPAPSLQLNYLVTIEKERNVLFNDILNTFY